MNMQPPSEPAEPDSLQELKQIDRICVEFEQAWSEGREEQIEKRLESCSGAVRQQLLWELLAIELHYRRRRGESPAAEAYQHRFPDSVGLIEAVYRDADAKNVAAAAMRPSPKQNKDEWRRLIQIYGPTVYRWCRGDGLQPSESADIVHKVFAAVALRVPEFRRERPGNSFRDWLWTVYRSQVNHLDYRHQNEPPEPGGTKLHQDEPELASAVSALAELPLLTQTMPLLPGDDTSHRFIRDYQLIEKLGEGGMGTVYLALHTWLEKPVAVKILRADRERNQETISRFQREMRAVGKLEHPHIVRALDAGEDRGVHFLVMEYVAGVELSRVAKEFGPLSVTDACEIIRQAALGLQHAHENDLVHRDVKPSNLMLSPEGGVKVLDLGLAHFRRSIHDSHELTRDGQVMGTFWYVAPEQLSPGRSVEAGCDVYSLAMTFRELLWPGAPKEVGVLGAMDPALRYLRRDVPDDVWRLLQHMAAVAQRDRPAMAEVAAALAPFAENADLVALFRRCADQAAQRMQQARNTHCQQDNQEARVIGDDASEGEGVIVVDADEDNRLAERILVKGLVWAEHNTNGRQIRLQRGKNELPEGDYRLFIKDLPWLKVRNRNTEFFSVPPGAEELNLECELEKSWLIAHIPDQEGDYAFFHGTLEYSPSPDSASEIHPYSVTLKVLEKEKDDGADCVWLMVEVTDQREKEDYRETGYLLIDLEPWQTEKRLVVKKGWIVAESNSISACKSRHFGDEENPLVVDFDPDEDRLDEYAKQKGFPLPPARINVQQAMVLFFDGQFNAAPPQIRRLRGVLTKDSKREFDFQRESWARGQLECLIVSSGGDTPTYRLARNDSIPFGFLNVNVNTPIFGATLKLNKHDSNASVAWDGEEDLLRWAANLDSLPDLPPGFDRASLAPPGAWAVWEGNVELFGGRPFDFRVSVNALPDEAPAHHRWLEVKVESGPRELDSTETALLLIDQNKYARGHPGAPPIVKGWLVSQGETFPYDARKGATAGEDGLLKLGKKLPLLRVEDVLTLMFDAGSDSSRLAPLRREVSVPLIAAGEDRHGTLKDLEGRDGLNVAGEVWELKLLGGIGYAIERSREIPFDFQRVDLNVPGRISLRTERTSSGWRGAVRTFADDGELETNAGATRERIDDVDKVNWRFWKSSEPS